MSAPNLGTKKTDALVEQLAKDIRGGVIPPGTRLRQADVAKQFHVSTTPVREAFAMLERQGLLVSSAHRGMTVFVPTVEELQETYEIRIPLETLATEKAVRHASAADLKKLESLLDRMSRVQDDPTRYGVLNNEFHTAIYLLAGRPKLARMIDELRDAAAAYLRFSEMTLALSPRDAHGDHTAIVEGFRAGDPGRAGAAMAAHLRRTVEMVSRILDERAADEPG